MHLLAAGTGGSGGGAVVVLVTAVVLVVLVLLVVLVALMCGTGGASGSGGVLVGLLVAPHSGSTQPATLCRFSWDREAAVRLLASQSWTNALVADAIPRWPGPGYITAPLVSACCFDNFTVQVNYNTTHGTTTQGYRLDMTNWATVHLPIEAAPNDFDIRQVLCGECGQCTVICDGLT